MKIITGATGTAHVTSNNDGEFNQAIFGDSAIVLPIGQKLKATMVDNNTIKISDGDVVYQGRHALIEPGMQDTLAIATGTVGYKRTDLIVLRYTCDISTGHETIGFVVKKGTQTTGSPVTPSATHGVIRTGSTLAEVGAFQVNINGVNITSIVPLLPVADDNLYEIARDATYTAAQALQKANKALEIVSFDATTGTLTTRTMQ